MSSIVGPNFTILTLPGGTTYRYIHVRPQAAGKPYILFLHGFPSSSYDWRHRIQYFSEKGYGIVAPDLLGYGGTDKPQDVQAYGYKKMCDEIVGILDHEGIQTVLGVGHDWGSGFLGKLANWYPSRFLSYAFLDVPYVPPGHFDLDAVNNATFEALGYTTFGYWKFFNAPDAPQILNAHIDSFSSLVYAPNADVWKTYFAPIGALRNWLTYDLMAPKSTYVTEEEMQVHKRIFSETGGYGPSLNWYRGMIANLNEADERGIPQLGTVMPAVSWTQAYQTASDLPQNRITLQHPTLFVVADRDPLVIASESEKTMRSYAPNLTVKHADVGHWVQLEAKDATNAYLEEFFTQVLRTAKRSERP